MYLRTNIINNVYLRILLLAIVFIYVSQRQLYINDNIQYLFNNDIFKCVYLSIMSIILCHVSIELAIIMSLIYVFLLNHIHNQIIRENMTSTAISAECTACKVNLGNCQYTCNTEHHIQNCNILPMIQQVTCTLNNVTTTPILNTCLQNCNNSIKCTNQCS